MAKLYHFKVSKCRMRSKCGVLTERYKTTYKNVTCPACKKELIKEHRAIADKIEGTLRRRKVGR